MGVPKNLSEPHESQNGVLGIDFGTTNTVAAFCQPDQDRHPDLIRYGTTSVALRSLLNVGNIKDGKGTILVGLAAEHRAETDPDPRTLISNCKSDLGCTEERRREFQRQLASWFPANQPVDPEDAAAFILSYVRKHASRQLQTSSTPPALTHAVIGIPARATQSYRLSLHRAAEIAGFEIVRLVPEPIAACWSYFLTTDIRKPRRVLVVDIGAGTTDLSLVDLSSDRFHVLLTAGDTQCGGTAVDHQLLRYLAQKYPDVDPSLRNFTNWQSVRQAKEKVNAFPDRQMMMNFPQPLALFGRNRKSVQVDVTGAEIHASAERVALRLRPLISDLFLHGIGTLPVEHRDTPVSHLVLVGGACRTRAFLEALDEVLKDRSFAKHVRLETPFSVDTASRVAADSYLAVAKGLARIGQQPGTKDALSTQMYFTSRLVDPVGLGVANDVDLDEVLPVGVLRNAVHLNAFTFISSYQGEWISYGLTKRAWDTQVTHVQVAVLAGEGYWMASDESADVEGYLRTARCLGEFSFKLAHPRNGKYVRIAVLYEMDANGIITVKVRDLGGDDPDVGVSYHEQSLEQAQEYRLTFGQLDKVATERKQQRLLLVRVQGELFDETVEPGAGKR